MQNAELVKMIDQERWLLNNGLISDSVKNQLFFCGSIVHKDILALDVNIDSAQKLVDYTLYVADNLLSKIEKYKNLSKATTIYRMWKFKRILKKEGCLDFNQVLGSFIAEYCGPNWNTKVNVLGFDAYVDSIKGQDETGATDKSSDAR